MEIRILLFDIWQIFWETEEEKKKKEKKEEQNNNNLMSNIDTMEAK